MVSAQSCRDADNSPIPSKSKVGAYNTRNSVIAFAVLGMILVLVDTALYLTGSIEKILPSFDLLVRKT